MKNVLDDLRINMMEARLDAEMEEVSLLATAIGELERKYGKVVSMEQLKEFAKSRVKSYQSLPDINMVDKQDYDFWLQYVPNELTETELYEFFTKQCAWATGLGEMMSALKKTHPNAYDGKQAASIARSILGSTMYK